MIRRNKVCLIGDVIVDVTLPTDSNDKKLRFGGIIHAARGLWALGVPFSVKYFSPSYLDSQIVKYLNSLGCTDISKLGNVNGAPYVFLIGEPKEIGNQSYDFLLRDEVEVSFIPQQLEALSKEEFDDYLIISGNYNLQTIVENLKGCIHIDFANNVNSISEIKNLNKKLNTIFVSTSSNIFQQYFTTSFSDFIQNFSSLTETIVLKENRGGSRAMTFSSQQTVNIDAQTKPIVHSVGVGDVFCSTYVSSYRDSSLIQSLTLSSWIAAEYAATTFPDDFKTNTERIIKSNLAELITIRGVSLPWEVRKKFNIYIAAPDFDFVNTQPIDELYNSLLYHNFNPHRPVIENGQMEVNAVKSRRQELFSKDMQLIEDTSILVAILLYNDPGTLIEIGIAYSKGIPVIVFDPYKIATNCMLTELPQLVSSDLDEIISEIFITASKLLSNG